MSRERDGEAVDLASEGRLGKAMEGVAVEVMVMAVVCWVEAGSAVAFAAAGRSGAVAEREAVAVLPVVLPAEAGTETGRAALGMAVATTATAARKAAEHLGRAAAAVLVLARAAVRLAARSVEEVQVRGVTWAAAARAAVAMALAAWAWVAAVSWVVELEGPAMGLA